MRGRQTKIMRLFSLGCHLELMHMDNCRTITDGADFKARQTPPGLIFSIEPTLILYKSFVALKWRDDKIIARTEKPLLSVPHFR